MYDSRQKNEQETIPAASTRQRNEQETIAAASVRQKAVKELAVAFEALREQGLLQLGKKGLLIEVYLNKQEVYPLTLRYVSETAIPWVFEASLGLCKNKETGKWKTVHGSNTPTLWFEDFHPACKYISGVGKPKYPVIKKWTQVRYETETSTLDTTLAAIVAYGEAISKHTSSEDSISTALLSWETFLAETQEIAAVGTIELGTKRAVSEDRMVSVDPETREPIPELPKVDSVQTRVKRAENNAKTRNNIGDPAKKVLKAQTWVGPTFGEELAFEAITRIFAQFGRPPPPDPSDLSEPDDDEDMEDQNPGCGEGGGETEDMDETQDDNYGEDGGDGQGDDERSDYADAEEDNQEQEDHEEDMEPAKKRPRISTLEHRLETTQKFVQDLCEKLEVETRKREDLEKVAMQAAKQIEFVNTNYAAMFEAVRKIQDTNHRESMGKEDMIIRMEELDSKVNSHDLGAANIKAQMLQSDRRREHEYTKFLSAVDALYAAVKWISQTRHTDTDGNLVAISATPQADACHNTNPFGLSPNGYGWNTYSSSLSPVFPDMTSIASPPLPPPLNMSEDMFDPRICENLLGYETHPVIKDRFPTHNHWYEQEVTEADIESDSVALTNLMRSVALPHVK